MPSHRTLQLSAIAISIISIFYNAAEGGLSIGFGAESSSRSLIFFGAQSAIEVASAAMVVWRFHKVAKPGEEKGLVLGARELRVEKFTSISIGCLLILLSLATEVTAIVGLALHQEPSTSNASLIISASALVIMILIWLPKRYLARALDSSAMQGEATCSLSCIQITVALFIGSLIFRVWRGGWWVDSATALVLGVLFGWEGFKMLRWARDPEFNGGCCGSCAPSGAGEMQQQYRDLCECCAEKDECKEAKECKCGSDVSGAGVDEESRVSRFESQQGCCTPMMPNGAKCCTHELTSSPRAGAQQSSTPTQPSPAPGAQSCNSCSGSAGQPPCCGTNEPQIPTEEPQTSAGCDSNTSAPCCSGCA